MSPFFGTGRSGKRPPRRRRPSGPDQASGPGTPARRPRRHRPDPPSASAAGSTGSYAGSAVGSAATSGSTRPAPGILAGVYGVRGHQSVTGGRAAVGRVVLHIGAMKTGTSFVQSILTTQPAALSQQGAALLGDRMPVIRAVQAVVNPVRWSGSVEQTWSDLAAKTHQSSQTFVA